MDQELLPRDFQRVGFEMCDVSIIYLDTLTRYDISANGRRTLPLVFEWN